MLCLGGKWNNLNRNQRAYLATQIAGNRQQSRFYALMNNYDRTLELVAEGSNSAGKAQQQFALYSNSLEASTNRLTNQWEKFFNSMTQGNGVISGINNSLTTLMKLVNLIGPLGTVLGITSFISSARKGINLFSNLNEKVKENKQLNDTYNSEVIDIEQSKFSDEEKTNRKNTAEYTRNKGLNENYNYFKQMGPVAEKYTQSIKDINEQQILFRENLNKDDKHLKGFKTSVNNATTSIKKGIAGIPLAIEQVKTAVVDLGLKFIALIAITKALELVGAMFNGIKSALNLNTEEYIKNAEKAKENSNTVQGLREEYESLANKISLTQDEQKRLKKIKNLTKLLQRNFIKFTKKKSKT